LKIELLNLGEVLESMDKEVKNTTVDLEKAIVETAFYVEREAVNNINLMRAVDTGRLKNSIHTEAPGINTYRGTGVNEPGDERFSESAGKLEALVGSAVEYARCVEFGLGTNRKRGERPYLRKARDSGVKYLWTRLKS